MSNKILLTDLQKAKKLYWYPYIILTARLFAVAALTGSSMLIADAALTAWATYYVYNVFCKGFGAIGKLVKNENILGIGNAALALVILSFLVDSMKLIFYPDNPYTFYNLPTGLFLGVMGTVTI